MKAVQILERKEVIRWFGVALMVAPFMNTLFNIQERKLGWSYQIAWFVVKTTTWHSLTLYVTSFLIGAWMLKGRTSSWRHVLFLLGSYILIQLPQLAQAIKVNKLMGVFFLVNVFVFYFIADQLVWKIKVAPRPVPKKKEESIAMPVGMAPSIPKSDAELRLALKPNAELRSASKSDAELRLASKPNAEFRSAPSEWPGQVGTAAVLTTSGAPLDGASEAVGFETSVSRIPDLRESSAAEPALDSGISYSSNQALASSKSFAQNQALDSTKPSDSDKNLNECLDNTSEAVSEAFKGTLQKTASETSDETSEKTVSETSDETSEKTVSETSDETLKKTASETSDETSEKTVSETSNGTLNFKNSSVHSGAFHPKNESTSGSPLSFSKLAKKRLSTSRRVILSFEGVGPWAELLTISKTGVLMKPLRPLPVSLQNRSIEIFLSPHLPVGILFKEFQNGNCFFEFTNINLTQVGSINAWLQKQAA